MFGQLLRRLKGRETDAAALYAAIVAQARQPAFYTTPGAPDTIMGRYQMIALHVILVLDRLLALREQAAAGGVPADERRARDLARALQEAMFDSMDAALREVGVSDPAMPKRMEKLVSLFYGQSKNCRAALALLPADEHGAHEALRDMLERNIFSGMEDAVSVPGAAALADYVMRAHAVLARHSLDDLAAGQLSWPAISCGGNEKRGPS